jgi:hypothetical protein
MSGIDNRVGIQKEVRDEISIRDKAMSGDITIEILTADVAPAPTAAIWSYTVNFQLIDTNGNVHNWYNGDIVAAASDTSAAGTAAVDDTSPAVVNGVGSVVLSGDAAAWLDTETALCTLNGTVLGKTLANKVFTVTFTAP